MFECSIDPNISRFRCTDGEEEDEDFLRERCQKAKASGLSVEDMQTWDQRTMFRIPQTKPYFMISSPFILISMILDEYSLKTNMP